MTVAAAAVVVETSVKKKPALEAESLTHPCPEPATAAAEANTSSAVVAVSEIVASVV